MLRRVMEVLKEVVKDSMKTVVQFPLTKQLKYLQSHITAILSEDKCVFLCVPIAKVVGAYVS